MIRLKSSPWFLEGPRWQSADLRLICFPYAGTGASAYRLWSAGIPREFEVCAVQPPGRESRFRDPPCRRIEDLVLPVVEALLPFLDRPFAVFGHSMGAIVASEFVCELSRRGARLPLHLFVSGRRAPHLPDPDPPFSTLPDAQFVAEIQRRYGGIPAEILADQEMLQVLLPALRADIAAIEAYPARADMRVECPLTVFGGTNDTRATQEQLAAWRDVATGSFRLRTFEGDHFYLTLRRQELLAEIVAALGPALARPMPGAMPARDPVFT